MRAIGYAMNEERSMSSADGETLISKLSFSHLTLLLPLREAEKRSFYEAQCMSGNWSVSELKRQINTLYYERSGMSINPIALDTGGQPGKQMPNIADIIKSPFTFEFLGLKAKDVVYENDLEQALVDNLEAFLIELGHGCQLKTYINYYKKEVMARDDNPPVGLLLVTNQNRALVEYAVADSDMQLFVSKYVINLPSKEQLQEFIQNELAQMRP
jgi:predicted nuclease of restriction endonuclease-like (RecB) superfamily